MLRKRGMYASPCLPTAPLCDNSLLLPHARRGQTFLVADEEEDGGLGDDEEVLVLIADLDGVFPKEEGVVTDFRLDGEVADRLLVAFLPGFAVVGGEVGDGEARADLDNPAGLHGLFLDDGLREVEADLGTVFGVFRPDQEAVADEKQLFVADLHRFEPVGPAKLAGRWVAG